MSAVPAASTAATFIAPAPTTAVATAVEIVSTNLLADSSYSYTTKDNRKLSLGTETGNQIVLTTEISRVAAGHILLTAKMVFCEFDAENTYQGTLYCRVPEARVTEHKVQTISALTSAIECFPPKLIALTADYHINFITDLFITTFGLRNRPPATFYALIEGVPVSLGDWVDPEASAHSQVIFH